MLELLKKGNRPKPKAKVETTVEEADCASIKCGACGHLRRETDIAPEWQCPSCQSAYNKVDETYVSQKRVKHRKKKKKDVKREESKVAIREKIDKASYGLIAGGFTIVQGMERVCKVCMKACVPSAGNPVLMVIGGVIVAATLAYMAWNYLKLH